MFKVLKTCMKILNDEPEEWLNFSSGQNSKTNLGRFKPSSEISGKILRILIFIRWFIIRFNPFLPLSKLKNKSDILIFASSINQLSVLDPIKKRLVNENVKVNSLSDYSVEKKLSDSFSDWNRIYFDYKILILVISLSIKYFFPLVYRLNKIDNRLPLLRLNGFLSVYAWLPYFYYSLKLTKPKIILLSNDHNPENRCLIEMARQFDIKTIYVQHGGVSERFHSLDFDYSFLDGQYSLDIYKKVENRRSPASRPPKKRFVALTGSLRRLQKKQITSQKCEIIGLTVKGTDSLKELAELCIKLNRSRKIIVRPHPSINFNSFVKQFKNQFPNQINIEFSNPQLEEVGSFLYMIDLLIAGNSTILLEAAIVKVIPIYFKSQNEKVDDYYGFVKNRLVKKFESIDKIVSYIETINPSNYKFNKDALKYYNASYDKAYNESDKIVTENILSLLKNSKLKSSNFVII